MRTPHRLNPGKPTLDPLPLSPEQVAHQVKCRASRLGKPGFCHSGCRPKTVKLMDRVRALLMDGDHRFQDLHEAMGVGASEAYVIIQKMRKSGEIVCVNRRLWRLVPKQRTA